MSYSAQNRRRKETAMISGAAIDRGAVGGLKLGAWLILLGSFVGSVVALNGGWAPVLAALPTFWRGLDPAAVVVGVLLQIIITWIEWHHRHKRMTIWYLFALIIDVALTFVGYQSLLVPLFGSGILRIAAHAAPETATTAGMLITLILSIGVAVLPEQILID